MAEEIARKISEDFWLHLQQAPRAVLLLDYDGTLAPFRIERDQAVPYPGIREILDAILAAGRTRLVVVSGRSIEDLLPLLGLKGQPEVWGCHGWEHRWPDGRHEIGKLSAEAVKSLQVAMEWANDLGLDEHCEIKPVSVALHWRGQTGEQSFRLENRVASAWGPLAEQTGLELHRFDGGIELRCPGKTKGTAVRRILDGLEKEVPVAYLGDDQTDEDAFAALGERGLSVLVRPEFRPTRADVWLQPPQQLLEFLQSWQKQQSGRDL